MLWLYKSLSLLLMAISVKDRNWEFLIAVRINTASAAIRKNKCVDDFSTCLAALTF